MQREACEMFWVCTFSLKRGERIKLSDGCSRMHNRCANENQKLHICKIFHLWKRRADWKNSPVLLGREARPNNEAVDEPDGPFLDESDGQGQQPNGFPQPFHQNPMLLPGTASQQLLGHSVRLFQVALHWQRRGTVVRVECRAEDQL